MVEVWGREGTQERGWDAVYLTLQCCYCFLETLSLWFGYHVEFQNSMPHLKAINAKPIAYEVGFRCLQISELIGNCRELPSRPPPPETLSSFTHSSTIHQSFLIAKKNKEAPVLTL